MFGLEVTPSSFYVVAAGSMSVGVMGIMLGKMVHTMWGGRMLYIICGGRVPTV